jgi:DNA-binding transcriptional MerR regulator
MPLNIDGKCYDIPGLGNIKLFPIAKLSQAMTDADIPRDTQTLRKWELAGILPKAIFRKGHKRLYSAEQIKCIVRIAKECNIRRGFSIEQTDFVTKVAEELGTLNKKYMDAMKSAKK